MPDQTLRHPRIPGVTVTVSESAVSRHVAAGWVTDETTEVTVVETETFGGEPVDLDELDDGPEVTDLD